MSNTWDDSIGKVSHSDAGIGVQVTPLPDVQPVPVIHSSFQHGLVTADSPEDIPRDSMQDMSDVRIGRDDCIKRLEGITLTEDVTPRQTHYIFEQAGLDYSTELVIFDPPYLGYRSTGNFTFVNLALAATGGRGWNIANYAGTMIFSNGTSATYTREPGAAVVTDISADIIAETFAVQFGRIFAGAITDPISGLQGLMIAWNGTTDPNPVIDWSSLNSGRELLLADDTEADRLIAIRSLGFDILAVLTRKALWTGTSTGVPNHPAQFKLRFPGRGCVAEPTAVVTPHGVVYLSDEGVVLFDGNNAEIISTAINASLLQLNYLQLNMYKAVYQPYRDRYVLATPLGVYYYEFERPGIPARWYFNSYIPDSLVIFVDQSGNIFWDTVQTTWENTTPTWAEMVQGELNAPALLYFAKGTKYGYEDTNASDYMGTAQNPYATLPQSSANPSDLLSTLWFEVEYSAKADASVQFTIADTDGNLPISAAKTLPNTNGVKTTGVFGFTGTGKGTTLQIKYLTDTANIYRIRQMVIPAGPSQMVLA